MVEFRWFPGIEREMERFLVRLSAIKPPPVRYSPQAWEPPMDVYETEAEVVVRVELAGIAEEEIEVIADSTTLVVRGERGQCLAGPQSRIWHRMEIFSGPFQRGIVLPTPVDPSQGRASYAGGLLEIVLPKSLGARTHRVRIKTQRP